MHAFHDLPVRTLRRECPYRWCVQRVSFREKGTPTITQLLAASENIAAARLILSGVKGIFYLIGGVIAAILCGFIGRAKGYSALLFAVLGFFLSIITLIVVLIIPKKR